MSERDVKEMKGFYISSARLVEVLEHTPRKADGYIVGLICQWLPGEKLHTADELLQQVAQGRHHARTVAHLPSCRDASGYESCTDLLCAQSRARVLSAAALAKARADERLVVTEVAASHVPWDYGMCSCGVKWTNGSSPHPSADWSRHIREALSTPDTEAARQAIVADAVAKARLDEAEWWEHLVGNIKPDHSDNHEPDCIYCERMTELRAAVNGTAVPPPLGERASASPGEVSETSHGK